MGGILLEAAGRILLGAGLRGDRVVGAQGEQQSASEQLFSALLLSCQRGNRSVRSFRHFSPYLSPIVITFHACEPLQRSGLRAFIANDPPVFGQTGREGREPSRGPLIQGTRQGKVSLSKKLYVGNLPFTSTEDELRGVFERHGAVDSVAVITDRETGRPRGFAFVEMSEESSAQDAIRALDGSDLGGRSVRVNEAMERERR